MHAGNECTKAPEVAAALGEAPSLPLSAPRIALAATCLACIAICPPSFMCDSPVLGIACAATWPLGSPRDSLILGYQEGYSFQGEDCVHRGVDLPGGAGSAVKAPCSGTVVFAGEVPANHADGGSQDGSTMTAVSIGLEDGRRLTLMPLQELALRQGDSVEEGCVVGTLAATGDRSSSQSHLHMGLKRDGRYCDPLSLFGMQGSSAGVAEQHEAAQAGAGAVSAVAPALEAAGAQASPSNLPSAGEEELEFGKLSSGEQPYARPAQQQEASWGVSASLQACMDACAAQLSSLREGLESLAQRMGVPSMLLLLAGVVLFVGICAALALQAAHLLGERCSSLKAKTGENALLCGQYGGGRMHKLFPAPGTSFITRGRSAQRR